MPKLARILEVSLDELMQVETVRNDTSGSNKVHMIDDVVLKGIGIAIGISVTVLSILGELETKMAFNMLGIGLASIFVYLLKGNEN